MGLFVSLILIAVGAILAWAVHPASSGAVDVNTVGYILLVIGIVGLILDLLLWESWGPAYLRRDVAVARRPSGSPPPAAAARSSRRRTSSESQYLVTTCN
jgi:hypothetical protein